VNKIFTPVAFSPLSKNNQPGLLTLGSKGKLLNPNSLLRSPLHNNCGNEENYLPGMLKVSPNSGFTQFKKPSPQNFDDQKSAQGSS
jgi:hypothetical protein